jgi:hypothetical protein
VQERADGCVDEVVRCCAESGVSEVLCCDECAAD